MMIDNSQLRFCILYGIKSFNSDGSERPYDANSDGNLYKTLEEAIKNQQFWFEGQIEEMKLHPYRQRIHEQAFCYIEVVAINEDGDEDYIELWGENGFDELARQIDAAYMTMNGSDVTLPPRDYMGSDDE